jgi:superfamily II DNA or RNA helicase
MKQTFKGWDAVAAELTKMATEPSELLDAGQSASLQAIACRIGEHGVILADEVGMGKTRIAVFVANAVKKCGGRVAVIVPPGLGYQWQREFAVCSTMVADILRSMHGYFGRWSEKNSEKPWYDENIMLISQRFADWRIRPKSDTTWRRALLPKVYAEARKEAGTRRPNGYLEYKQFYNHAESCKAACSIVNAVPDDSLHPARDLLDQLLQNVNWQDTIVPQNYLKNGDMRIWHERIVGLGLGAFDLVILDEAHKNRGKNGGLSTLLDKVLLASSDNRRLGLTATPIDIDVSQWKSMLTRIKIKPEECEKAGEASEAYLKAVHRLRQCWHTDPAVREEYRQAKDRFQCALSPYLLRRDKRSDETVKAFLNSGEKDAGDYRQLSPVEVNFSSLTTEWKKIVCAAEGLSVVKEKALSSKARRMRLSIGNGHSIASLIDEMFRDAETDKAQLTYEQGSGQGKQQKDGPETVDADDTTSRRIWWENILEKNTPNNADDVLFDHPAILAAVAAIEAEVSGGEKILVFGRFTRPMRALVDLLNARQMLRAIGQGTAWPQSKVHGERHVAGSGDWSAVNAAHRQLGSKIDLDQLDQILARQYDKARYQRKKQKGRILGRLTKGLESVKNNDKYRKILASIPQDKDDAGTPATGVTQLLAEAIFAMSDNAAPDDADLAKAFIALVDAISDQDSPDDEEQAIQTRDLLAARLTEDYASQRARFALLMNGQTPQHSRRMMQLAFNRPNSFPRVLVAQSVVGREGLNLHESCRIVVLLHSEWNPGVVEQQIGRVDRIGSRWAREIKNRKPGQPLLRIEIRPVIFKGTYDEHHWRVLQQRWEDLRAQLHGEVLPARLRLAEDEEGKAIFDALAKDGPDFYPRKMCKDDDCRQPCARQKADPAP